LQPLRDSNGAIVVADDQAINLEVMKSSLKEFNLLKKCSFAINGQEAVDQVERAID